MPLLIYVTLPFHISFSFSLTLIFLFSFLYPIRKTNSGQSGVWVYEIGSSPFFFDITSGMVTSLPEGEDTSEVSVTMLPREPETQTTRTTEAVPEDKEIFPTERPAEYQPSYPEAETVTPGYAEPETEEPEYEDLGELEPEYPDSETVAPTYASPERVQPRYPEQTESQYPYQPEQPRYTIPEPGEPRYPVDPRYTNPEPVQPVPPHTRPQQPEIVVVDEDEDLNVNGKLLKPKDICV